MSRNLNQIPTQATSILPSDKMYIARSPFGVTDDRYILGSDIIAQLASPLTTKGDLYGFSTVDARLPVAVGDGKILQVSSAAAVGLAYSTPTYPSASGTLGKLIISDGTNNVYSTSLWPNTVGVTGSIIISNGTSNIYSTSLWPNTVGTALHLLLSDGTSNVYSTPAYPNASVTSGKFIISDGTNYIASTSIMPNTVGAAGKIIRSDGTVNAYSTSTFADTYLINTILFAASANTIAGASLSSIIDASAGSTQGNILYRNATTWVVLAPGSAGQFLQTAGAAANVLWASGNSGTVTSFSAGTLSPLFTTSVANSTTTPALSFILTNAGANTYFGNATGGSAAPSYTAAGALTKTDDTNVTLTLGGAPTVSLLAATSLTLGWTGVLSLARGGTNANLTASNGGIFYSTASAAAILSGTATANQMLQSGSTAAPSWSTTTWPATSTAGRILYSTFNNVIGELTTTARAVLGSSSTSVPNWLALTDGQFVIGSTAGAPAAASLSAGSGISITPGSNSISIATTGAVVTPAALTKTDDTNVTLTLGGSPNTALVNAASLTLGWTGQLSIARGGTAVSSVTVAPAATAWAGWDANKNMSANSLIEGYTTTATAAATTTLVVGSTWQQFFTGSSTQTIVLPVTSTLVLGQSFYIVNNSSGNVTVNSSGANAIQVMAASTTLLVTCILTSGTTAASWAIEYVAAASGSALTNNHIFVGNSSNIATDVAMSGDATIVASGALTIANSAVTNVKMANMADQTIKGNVSGGAAAPSDLTKTQVLTMLGSTINQVNTQTITATGAFTYTPTVGTKYAIFELQAAGGASGSTTGAGASSACGGAGSAGGYLKLLVSGTTNLAAITGSVGAGGTVGASGNNPGNTGGSTTLVVNSGTTWTAGGGGGGGGQTAGAAAQAAGTPGTGGTNTTGTNGTLQLNIAGQNGSIGYSNAAVTTLSILPPQGGNSQLGRGGAISNAAATGIAGSGYGSGAGGGLNGSGSNQTGSAGQNGIVVITEFISV